MIEISPELNDAIKANSQDVHSRVDVVFADSRHLENISSSVTNAGTAPTGDYETFFSKEQAYNGYNEETFPWATAGALDHRGEVITANGEYYALPADELELEFGWWTNSSSDGSGDFLTPEVLEILFDDRLANSIKFSTAYTLGRISAARISYKTTADVWVDHDATLNVDEWEYEWSLGEDIIIRGVKIRVDSTHNPNDIGRVHEFSPIYTYTLTDDDIVSFGVEEVRENTDYALPIGNTAANTFNLVLENVDKRFNPDGDGRFSQFMRGDIILKPYVGWEIDNVIEYIGLGEFYADEIDFSSDMSVNISSRDFSKYLQDQSYEEGIFFQGVSVGRAIADTARVAGVPGRKIKYFDGYWDYLKRLNPVALWKFNESPEIDDVNDLYEDEVISDSHSNNHGVINYSSVQDIELGELSLMPGYSDASVKFTGANSNITIPNDASITMGSAFTIMGTLQLNATPVSSNTFYQKGSGGKFNYAMSVNSSRQVVVSVRNSADTIDYAVSSAPINLGEAYFFAFWLDVDAQRIYLRINETIYESLTSGVTTLYTSIDNLIFGGVTPANIAGSLQGVALFDRQLSAEEIDKLYVESKISEIYHFPYLYFIENTFWDGMLEWATADLGTFYFDRDGIFNYEYRNTLHEAAIDRHTISQFSFSDKENIIAGSRIGQIQSNKVIVVVNPITTINSDMQSIWRAEEGESLVVTSAVEYLNNVDTDSIKVKTTRNPLWLDSGYFKMNEEIIKYDSKSGNRLIGLTRGQFGTTPADHGSRRFSFERGRQGWRRKQSADFVRSSAQAHLGTKSLKVILQQDVNEDRPIVTSAPGKSGLVHGSDDVTVTGWIYSQTAARQTRMSIIWYRRNGSIISSSDGTQSNSTLSGWKSYTVVATPPNDSRYFAAAFEVDGNDNDVFYIDNIYCTNVKEKVREVRFYDIEYDQAPAIRVQYPFITADIFDKTVTIESFEAGRFSAKVLLSANESVGVGETVVLEGVHPGTELVNYFAIAGIPLVEESSSEEVEEIAAENSGSIRKHKIKEMTIDNKFIQDKSYAQVIVDFLIDHYKNEVPIMNLEATGVPQIELGDRIDIGSFDQLGDGKEFWIMSASHAYDGGLTSSYTLREVS